MDYSKINLLKEFRFFYEFVIFLIEYIKQLFIKKKLNIKKPIIVVPGFLSGDINTKFFRMFLKSFGLIVYGWGQGLNLKCDQNIIDKLNGHIDKIFKDNNNRKVILIGWSLGGIISREIVKQNKNVCLVISLGSPIIISENNISIKSIYRWLMTPYCKNYLENNNLDNFSVDIPVHLVYSNFDGLLSQKSCCKLNYCYNHFVKSSHMGFIYNKKVIDLILNIIKN